jgi:large subunit ribosomal protein L30
LKWPVCAASRWKTYKSMVAKEKTKSAAAPTIRIQYYRSTIACPEKQKQIVISLGLRKLNQIVERPDTPSMRGAVAKVPHLLRIIE